MRVFAMVLAIATAPTVPAAEAVWSDGRTCACEVSFDGDGRIRVKSGSDSSTLDELAHVRFALPSTTAPKNAIRIALTTGEALTVPEPPRYTGDEVRFRSSWGQDLQLPRGWLESVTLTRDPIPSADLHQ